MESSFLLSLYDTCRDFLIQNSYDVSKMKKLESYEDIIEYINVHPLKEYFENENISFEISPRVALTGCYRHKSNGTKILVFFAPQYDKGKDLVSKVNTLKTYLECDDVLLITSSNMSDQARVELELCDIIHYVENSFINPLIHSYCPKSIEIIRDTKKFVEDNRIKISQLPKIRANDPLAKFFQAKPGNIIKTENQTELVSLAFVSPISYYYVIPQMTQKKK